MNFFGRTYDYLTTEQLEKHKDEFLKLSNITEADIRDIYIKPEEKFIHNQDLPNIVYHFSEPLYIKMIFRFRNTTFGNPSRKPSIASFHRQVDPHNQHLLQLKYFKDIRIIYQLLEFFAWISSSLGLHDIILLSNDVMADDTNYINEWYNNVIQFYFNLPPNIKLKLITQYNEECIEPLTTNNVFAKYNEEM